jgi:hypothetical protein
MRALSPNSAGRRVLSAVATLVTVAVIGMCATTLAPTPAAAALPATAPVSVDGATALAFLNQQRAASGIPPVTINQAFVTAWCPNEDTGPSGGESSRDLSPVTAWSATSSPWDNAPLHQFSMYDPIYGAAGDANVAGQACMGFGDLLPAPSTPAFYAFVADGGPSVVPNTEVVPGEGPFAPQQLVGIPDGQPTGPQPLLYALGMGSGVHALSWALTAANGSPVSGVKFVDEATVGAAGYAGYIAQDSGGIMIPPPLAPATTYTGVVTWEGLAWNGSSRQGDPAIMDTQAFSFTTAPLSNAVTLAAAGEGVGDDATQRVTLSVTSNAPSPTLTLSGPGGQSVTPALTPTSSGYQTILVLASGTWQACVQSGGGSSGYVPASNCQMLTTALITRLRVNARKQAARKLLVTVQADAGAHGSVTVRIAGAKVGRVSHHPSSWSASVTFPDLGLYTIRVSFHGASGWLNASATKVLRITG